jgi:hypothetical protein
MASQSTLDLVVMDDCMRLGDRGRPPRLLVVVRGIWAPDQEGLPWHLLRAGVCGVSLGVSVAEHVPASDGMLYEAGAAETCVADVAPPLAWRDVQRDETRELLAALAALGVPSREPDLDGICDTSDYEHVTTLVGAIDRHAFHVCLQRMCSGYGGQDARAFAALMRVVLVVARLDPDADRWASLFATGAGEP